MHYECLVVGFDVASVATHVAAFWVRCMALRPQTFVHLQHAFVMLAVRLNPAAT
jgi:hypothetical protein